MTTDWAKETNCAITIVNTKGDLIYMNDKSRETFCKGGDMMGENIEKCHKKESWAKVQEMLATGKSNSYSITKNGVKKIIYQTPWRENGEIAGLVEISMVVPNNMPHYDRDKGE